MRGKKYVALPPYLKPFSRCLTNIQNKDDHCLVLCVLAKLFSAGTRKVRASQYYKYFDRLNLTGLKQDFRISDVELLEKNNPNLSVNVNAPDEENQRIVGYRYSKREKKDENDDDVVEIDLLLIHDGEQGHYHYALINSLVVFVKNLHTKKHSTVDVYAPDEENQSIVGYRYSKREKR